MIRIQDLYYRYPGESSAGLEGISLDIPSPCFVGILGGNGAGKSTLAKVMAGLLVPEKGRVEIDGLDTRAAVNQPVIRDKAALILQNPENQIVGTTLEEDIAFGLENRNMPSEEMEQVVEDSLRTVKLLDRRFSAPDELSGGEQQRLVLAGMLARHPRYLILDEATTMLDPAGRREFLGLLKEIQRRREMSVILITHYTDELVDADRIFLVSRGRLLREGSPEEILSDFSLLRQEQIQVPYAARFSHELRKNGLELPASVITQPQLISALVNLYRQNTTLPDEMVSPPVHAMSDPPVCGSELLRAESLHFSYSNPEAKRVPLIRDLSLRIHEGDRIALIGASGSGKSTLLRLLNGLLRADQGELFWRGESVFAKKKLRIPLCRRTGLVFQHPDQQLFTRTVRDEVAFGPRNLGKSTDETEAILRRSLALAGLDPSYDDRHPLALSGGEQRRVAIAAVLSMECELLLLDEPGSGLDVRSKEQLFTLLEGLTLKESRAVVFITHQMDEVVRYANKIWLLEGGKVRAFSAADEFFREREILRHNRLELPTAALYAEDLRAAGLTVKGEPLRREELALSVTQLFRQRKAEEKL